MIKANQCRTPETPKSFKTLPVLKIVLDKIVTNSKSQMSKNADNKGIAYHLISQRNFAIN